MTSHFIWRGTSEPESKLSERLAEWKDECLRPRTRLDVDRVLGASEILGRQLSHSGALRREFTRLLLSSGRFSEKECEATLNELSLFLNRSHLEEKISRELPPGPFARSPFRLERADFKSNLFESWVPLGVVVHIAPNNAANVPFLSVLEALITGNVCFLKTGRNEVGLAERCLESLAANDESGVLQEYIYAASLSSQDATSLKTVLEPADGVAVWGGEEAVSSIRSLSPPGARLIDWGPKISFAYLHPKDAKKTEVLKRLAFDCCEFDQQSCSSPQVVYLDTEDLKDLNEFADNFAPALVDQATASPLSRLPSPPEQAEITRIDRITQLESCLPNGEITRVFSGEPCRIYVDRSPALIASPLFRTLWVKPLPKNQIRQVLWPMRRFLQTAGVSVPRAELAETLEIFYGCGVQRITGVGEMLSGYQGEPHDGVYALQRYSRRVSARFESDSTLNTFARVEDLARRSLSHPPTTQVMDKAAFQQLSVDRSQSDLYFKSGGTTGRPKLSIFTYDDYHFQMKAAASGLLAAGFEPKTDRSIDLFAAGALYGGFLSFFSILEALKAPQLPMAAHHDLNFVTETIIDQEVNTIFAMPSYLLRLFEERKKDFQSYRGIKKIFYGGEHLTLSQKHYLGSEFGVELIKSAAYGGNDTGPIGFQCLFSDGGVHHLHDDLHHLEILQLEIDRAAADGEIGRLVLSSKMRHGQNISRYDSGDIGRWTLDAHSCRCGRQNPKFELLGRYGDIFRASGWFFNARTYIRALSEANYPGEMQLIIRKASTISGTNDEVLIRATESPGWNPEKLKEICLASDDTLREAVCDEKLLALRCEMVPKSDLLRNSRTSKLRLVIDERD